MYVKEEYVRYLRTYLRSFRGFYRTGPKQGCPENKTMVEMSFKKKTKIFFL